MNIIIDGDSLTINQVHNCAYNRVDVTLSDTGRAKLTRSRKDLEVAIAGEKSIYGVNTGFGIFSEKKIPIDQAKQLSRNLILSHAVSTGLPLPLEAVRAAMLIRANSLSKGFSGINPEIVSSIIDMLNKDVVPLIPSQGSLGASGDLSLLAQLCLVLSRDDEDREDLSGRAYFEGILMSGKNAMMTSGIDRVILGYKDGLSLINGATFSCAMGALLVAAAERLVDLADDIAAISMEALHACSSFLDKRIHEVRGHPGQITSAQRIANAICGSNMIDSENTIQDPYSLRCAPQVHGAVRDVIANVKAMIETEMNSATDNPLIFSQNDVVSGGNFHGEPVGFGMDFLAIVLAELGAISERRIFRLLDHNLSNGLPPMLVKTKSDTGLNSGLMMPHYTAVSLALENQTLAHPDSVHSMPTSGEQEDHNSNSMTAARHAWLVCQNLVKILTIEAYTAAQAVDIRLNQSTYSRLGDRTRVLYKEIRTICPYIDHDALWGAEIARLEKHLRSNHILLKSDEVL